MPTVAVEELDSWTEIVLMSVGAPSDVARIVSKSLVGADLRGHSSHGVRLLPRYLERIDRGSTDETVAAQNRIDPVARPRVERRDGVRVLLDGGAAFGRVVGHDAVEVATSVVDDHGVAVVGIRDGNHLGRMGEWAELAADAGLASLAFVKAEASLVAPAGTADRRLSTNPIAAGVPTFGALEFPIVLDVATSVVAGGKVWERHRTGASLPDGWVVDEDGDEMSTPGPFVDGTGALLPLGGTTAGHKGFGLAVVAELFGALLGNGVVAGEREHVHFNNSVAMVVVDPTWFTPAQVIADRIGTFADYVREARPVPGLSPGAAAADGERVLLPGEPEHRAEQLHRREGVPLPRETVADLNDCGRSVGCGPLVE